MTPDATPRRAAPDPDRRILRLTGAEAEKFLQGLVTNDLHRLARDGILYAALLTPQGKYLTDFFLVAAGAAILIDAPAAAADDLARRLAMYRLRSAVQIEPAAVAVTRGLGDPPPGALADPRGAALGWRLYGPALTEGDPVDWDTLAVRHCVPQHGADLVPGDSFILEYDFARLHGVDFRKGCYVGQEVTARMHHKTDLRRGLYRVALDGAAAPGTAILTDDGREAGRLGTVSGAQGLALLRHDRREGALRAGTVTVRVLDAD